MTFPLSVLVSHPVGTPADSAGCVPRIKLFVFSSLARKWNDLSALVETSSCNTTSSVAPFVSLPLTEAADVLLADVLLWLWWQAILAVVPGDSVDVSVPGTCRVAREPGCDRWGRD
jgi:hypothetical protein